MSQAQQAAIECTCMNNKHKWKAVMGAMRTCFQRLNSHWFNLNGFKQRTMKECVQGKYPVPKPEKGSYLQKLFCRTTKIPSTWWSLCVQLSFVPNWFRNGQKWQITDEKLHHDQNLLNIFLIIAVIFQFSQGVELVDPPKGHRAKVSFIAKCVLFHRLREQDKEYKILEES